MPISPNSVTAVVWLPPPLESTASLRPRRSLQAAELLAHQQVNLLVEEMGHVTDAIASARELACLGQKLQNVAVQDRKIDTAQIEEVAHVGERALPGNRQDADVAELGRPLGQGIGGACGATVGIGYAVGENSDRAHAIHWSGPRRLRRQGDKGDRACRHWQRQAAHSDQPATHAFSS